MKLVGLFYLYRWLLSTIQPHHRRKGIIRFEEEERTEAQGGKHKNGKTNNWQQQNENTLSDRQWEKSKRRKTRKRRTEIATSDWWKYKKGRLKTQKKHPYFLKKPRPCNTLIISALQYPLFCVVKVPVLHGKRAYIATQNRRFCKTKEFRAVLEGHI